MSDSDPEKKGESPPSWQTKPAEQLAGSGETAAAEPKSRQKNLEQAQRFLEDEEVKDAPTDKKIAFLESKGLKKEDIHSLLGVSRNEEASSNNKSETPPRPEASQILIPPKPVVKTPQPSQSSSQPPIITYPEFLTTPQHPQPLITTPRLLTTLYTFGAFTAILYGTHNYLVTPMLASLTAARLDLASTTSSNLQKLLAKLEALVSVVPPTRKNEHSDGDDDEEDEDPTEMFHRDIGVQTSPPQSRPASPSPSPLEAQSLRLGVLTTHLKEIQTESISEGEKSKELETTMGVLREYLDGMAYVAPRYDFGYGGVGGRASAKEEDDEIGRVKAGIRGVKGVLLSARSFPGGVRAR